MSHGQLLLLGLSFALAPVLAGCGAAHKGDADATAPDPSPREPDPGVSVAEDVQNTETSGAAEEMSTEDAEADPAEAGEGWKVLFDGRSLDGWESVDFGGQGETALDDGVLRLEMGSPMSGVTWRGEPADLPALPYEMRLEAMRIDGNELFCGVTFPVGETSASLVLGGWGGGVCGISSLDGMDAANNETATYHEFERDRWYTVRLVVTDGHIAAWLDDEQIVHAHTEGRGIGTRIEAEPTTPLGLFNYVSVSAFRDIRWRPFDGELEE